MRRIGLAALVAVCIGCGAAGLGLVGPTATDTATVSVGEPDTGGGTLGTLGENSWIFHPAELPPGKIGKNDCTFRFAQNGDPNFHPQNASDPKQSSCWETNRGHEAEFGVPAYRQQFRDVHFPASAMCGGGPGDLDGIRICFRDEQGNPIRGKETPCGRTGPNGCVACRLTVFACH